MIPLTQNHRLIVFAREPEPGRVKTRLAASLGPAAAAKLYAAMLADTVAKAAELPGVEPFLFVAGNTGWFTDRFPAIPVFPQAEGDLGERMEDAFARLFAAGTGPVCIIGTDSPDLPPDHIVGAFAKLEHGAEAVFGPSADGGYYLLGMKRLHAPLFRGIAWSTDEVLARSLAIAAAEGLTTALLPEWHDVDLPEDLARPGMAAGENGAVMTGEFLRRMGKKAR